jgi:hypothetical protein
VPFRIPTPRPRSPPDQHSLRIMDAKATHPAPADIEELTVSKPLNCTMCMQCTTSREGNEAIDLSLDKRTHKLRIVALGHMDAVAVLEEGVSTLCSMLEDDSPEEWEMPWELLMASSEWQDEFRKSVNGVQPLKAEQFTRVWPKRARFEAIQILQQLLASVHSMLQRQAKLAEPQAPEIDYGDLLALNLSP